MKRAKTPMWICWLSTDKRREMVRLRKFLRPLRMPVELMVSDEATVRDWGSLPGTAMYWALKEGEVLHESA